MNRMSRETRGTFWPLATALALVMIPSLVTASKAPIQPPPPTSSKLQVVEFYSKLPLAFEANDGQTDSRVTFLARGKGYTLFLTREEAVMVLRAREEERGSSGSSRSFGSAGAEPSVSDQTRQTRETKQTRQTVLRMRLEGSNPSPLASGLEPLPGIVNYFIGNDPKKWRTNIPTYQKVEYQNIYSGIDLVYYGNQRQLEYDFVVSPGSDPNQIKLAFEGAKEITLADSGDLILTTESGDVRLQKPLVYQLGKDGHKELIAGNYVVHPTLTVSSPGDPLLTPMQWVMGEGQGEGTRHVSPLAVAFQVAVYDRTEPLIIDPVLVYSTYLGGAGDDFGVGIALDAAGSAYVTGGTNSLNFPIQGAVQNAFDGRTDAFVAKLNAAGSSLVYSTYLGGGDSDQGFGIAVDAAGNANLTGIAGAGFPNTSNDILLSCTPVSDAFVTKLNPTGSGLIYSICLGDFNTDEGRAIAVDADDNAYVTGLGGTGFFTTPGLRSCGFGGAFVTKLNPTVLNRTHIVYSTCLGGPPGTFANGIAVDADRNAYVTGIAGIGFPTTPDAAQMTFGGGSSDAFVTKLNLDGSFRVYSTYLGGTGVDIGNGITVDAGGSAYVTGETRSTDFPTTAGALDITCGTDGACNPIGTLSLRDAFVTKLNEDGSARDYSTYLGGSRDDWARDIAVDGDHNAYVTGVTFSADFPTTPDAVRTTPGGFQDAFVTKLDSAGAVLAYSTYLGGVGGDEGSAIAVDAGGNAYVTGLAGPGFPTTPGAFQSARPGGGDAFVAKLSPFNTPVGANVTVQVGQVTVTFANVTPPGGDTTLTTSAAGPPPPAGFKLGDPATYFDITTAASFSPPVNVCITYDPAHFGDPASLRLFHFENNAWVDVTVTDPPPPAANTICGTVTSLSPFAIFEPASQPFATFRPEVEIKLRPAVKNDTFEMEAFFTLSNGINLLTELSVDVSFTVGSFSTPPVSFTKKKGRFEFKGVIDGVRLAATIRPSRRGGFKFEAEGKCADLDGTVNPVTVELTIGDDRGSAAVTADIESSRRGGKCGDRWDDDKDDKDDKDDDDD
jgi:hypothetical protein